jgi:hypothetical protein
VSSIPQIANIKSSIVTDDSPLLHESSYVIFCQVCRWYGYAQEKIIIEFEGIRSEDEDGFVDIFTEYEYDTETGEKGTKHIHKYDPKLVQKAVDFAQGLQIGMGTSKND